MTGLVRIEHVVKRFGEQPAVDLVSPRFVRMRYFFFPFGELRSPSPDTWASTFQRVHTGADFLVVTAVTPLFIALPSIVRFAGRDISE